MLICLTVFFEEPFWIGVFELVNHKSGELQVAKVVFGAEPKENEIYDLIIRKYHTLELSKNQLSDSKLPKKLNAKRMKRLAAKDLADAGISTKSQNALRELQEVNKKEKKSKSKSLLKDKQEYKLMLKDLKRKEKKKGH